ncbi:MAG: hypothetical protein FWG87_14340 [Defluviitaleaceae bacterium]|nr:hypothetical protein [Defluviitaleaceae bacterium]
MRTGEECSNMNVLEAKEEQLLQYYQELHNKPEKEYVRNSPIIDGSMEALFQLIDEGVEIYKEEMEKAAGGSINE